ncbi:MAG: hypothetical protein KatS3mg027_2208 [Bacteroidia bacterium]|nr:MAG: hypothetical protein KatS3mg027_2208 [Bacteroidia bacterium]
MKRLLLYILINFLLGIVVAQSTQAYPAKLKCVSVINSAGDIVIQWIPPLDPQNQFYAYEIFQSNSNLGPYLLINTINNIAVNSFTHVGAGWQYSKSLLFHSYTLGTGRNDRFCIF